MKTPEVKNGRKKKYLHWYQYYESPQKLNIKTPLTCKNGENTENEQIVAITNIQKICTIKAPINKTFTT